MVTSFCNYYNICYETVVDTAYKVQSPSALVATKDDQFIYFCDGNNIGALVFDYVHLIYRSILVAGSKFFL